VAVEWRQTAFGIYTAYWDWIHYNTSRLSGFILRSEDIRCVARARTHARTRTTHTHIYRKLVKKLYFVQYDKSPHSCNLIFPSIRYLKMLWISFKASAASRNQNVVMINTEESTCKRSLLQFHCLYHLAYFNYLWFEKFFRVLESSHKGRCEPTIQHLFLTVSQDQRSPRTCVPKVISNDLNLERQLTSFGKAESNLK